jgi:hypothetical protein
VNSSSSYDDEEFERERDPELDPDPDPELEPELLPELLDLESEDSFGGGNSLLMIESYSTSSFLTLFLSEAGLKTFEEVAVAYLIAPPDALA